MNRNGSEGQPRSISWQTRAIADAFERQLMRHSIPVQLVRILFSLYFFVIVAIAGNSEAVGPASIAGKQVEKLH